jgi:hypothetical protein
MAVPHSRPQILQSAELQLFDRALATSKFLRDFPQAFLVYKTAAYHQALVRRKFIHQLEENQVFFDPRVAAGFIPVVRRNLLLFSGPPPSICQTIARDPKQPCCKRDALPLEARRVPQRFVKDLRGQIFGVLATRDAPGYECVHAVEIVLVKFGELRRVTLRRFDQKLFVRCVLKDLQKRSPQEAVLTS